MPLLSPKTPVMFFCLLPRLRGHGQLNSLSQSSPSTPLPAPVSLLRAFPGLPHRCSGGWPGIAWSFQNAVVSWIYAIEHGGGHQLSGADLPEGTPATLLFTYYPSFCCSTSWSGICFLASNNVDSESKPQLPESGPSRVHLIVYVGIS